MWRCWGCTVPVRRPWPAYCTTWASAWAGSFGGDYFEARWLSDQLRRWWNEPDLREVVASGERVGHLSQWVRDMESTGPATVGAKHPLLVLCGDDLREAWGAETLGLRPAEDRKRAAANSIRRRELPTV